MKAVIIAAGRGKRLGPHTQQRPKCLVEVAGRTILDRQLESFRHNGIRDICVITGWQGHLIDRPGLSYRRNQDWERNNILLSLSHAHDFLDDETIVTYSDLVMTPATLAPLVAHVMDRPFALQADTDYAAYYQGRSDHPVGEAESIIWDEQTMAVREVGKRIPHKEATMGEFTGVWRLSREGCLLWTQAFRQAQQETGDGPFGYAPCFTQAFLTDLMMWLMARGVGFSAVPGRRQVMEIDTEQDLSRVHDFLK